MLALGGRVLLVECNYSGEWADTDGLNMSKAALLRYDGFPSIVNLRAEEGPTDKHLAQNLRVDVENWSDWEGAKLLKPLRVFGGGHTDLTTVEWELRFNMAVRGVRLNPDTPQRWDSYAQCLSSKYIAG